MRGETKETDIARKRRMAKMSLTATEARRTSIDVIADILQIAREGARITHIVYKGNLNFKMAHRYVRDLLKRGLMREEPPLYHSTAKGDLYIARYHQLTEVRG